MELGTLAIPSCNPPLNVKFKIDDEGNVTFVHSLPTILNTSIPSMVDTIRENHGFPPIKRTYCGTQAPQWR